MKVFLFSKLFLLFSTISFIFISGCQDEKDNAKSNISGSIINYSECKSANPVKLGYDDWDTNYCFQYNYFSSTQILNMKHINAIFNCCPDSIYAAIDINSDTIIIHEYELEKLCSCVCQYDLDFELNGVERDKYIVKLVVPETYYLTGGNPLIFEMNLESADEGEYCW